MEDVEKIIKGWERCLECEKTPIGTSQAYAECEYTIGLYCGRDKLIWETIRALKEQNKRKHGHWIVLTNCSNEGVYCSECGTKLFDKYPMKKKFSQYCGHCGSHNDLNIERR